MKKKLLASLLALSLTLGLCTSAFAEDAQVTDGSATVTAETILVLPKIEVYVGAAPTVIVNPYQMSYSNDDLEIDDERDSLMSVATAITNKSPIGITVSATPKVVVGGGSLTLASQKSEVTGATTPKLFVFLHLLNLASSEVTDSNGTVTVVTGTYAPEWATDTKADGTTAVATAEGTNEATIVMDAAATDGTPTYAGFKLIGESGGPNWEGSTIAASVILKFTPVLGTGTAPTT